MPRSPSRRARPGRGSPTDKEIVGKIKDVEATASPSMTLEDGTVLVIPDQNLVGKFGLKAGTTVKVSYAERDGRKVLTALEVQPAR